MAVEAITQSIGIYSAGENMESNQFHAVRFNMFERWQLTAGNIVHGILNNAPISGSVANVVVFGVSKAKLGGTVISGRQLTSDINSRFVEGSGSMLALENGNAGDIISVFISVSREGSQERVVRINGDYTIEKGDQNVIGYNTSLAQVYLRINPSLGEVVSIKRKSGVINVVGTIDGFPCKLINVVNYSLKLIFDGIEWSEI